MPRVIVGRGGHMALNIAESYIYEMCQSYGTILELQCLLLPKLYTNHHNAHPLCSINVVLFMLNHNPPSSCYWENNNFWPNFIHKQYVTWGSSLPSRNITLHNQGVKCIFQFPILFKAIIMLFFVQIKNRQFATYAGNNCAYNHI